MVEIGDISVELNNVSIKSEVSERLIGEWNESAWLDSLFIFVGINLFLLFVVVTRHILKNRKGFGKELSLLLHTNYYTLFIYKKFIGKPLWRYMLGFIPIVIAGVVIKQHLFANPLENLAITLVFFVLSWGILFGFEDLWLE